MASSSSSSTRALLVLFVSVFIFSVGAWASDMYIISYGERSDNEVRSLHSAWMVEHGKSYNALGESERRFEIFKENLCYIDEQNALHTPLFPYPHRASAMSVIANSSSPQSLKFLIYGRTGWIGSFLSKLCEVQSKKATTQP